MLPVRLGTLIAGLCLLQLLPAVATAEPADGPVLPATGPRPVSVLAEEEPAGQLDERPGSLSEVGASNTDTVPTGREPTMQELLSRIKQLESEHDTLEAEHDTFSNRFTETGDLGRMIRRSASAPMLDERSGSLSAVGPSNTNILSTAEDAYRHQLHLRRAGWPRTNRPGPD